MDILIRWGRDPQSPFLFNCGSPSSRKSSVRRIEALYVTPDSKILDVGGTEAGFSSHTSAAIAPNIVIVNPNDRQASYETIDQVPNFPRYDLIMMFGVLRNLKKDDEILKNFRSARNLLNSGGVFLVAEPEHLKLKPADCISTLVEAGFKRDKIESRLDLRPGWSATKYYIFACRND